MTLSPSPLPPGMPPLRHMLLTGAWLGGLLMLPFIAAGVVVNIVLDIPLPGFAFLDWAARTLPGGFITAVIDGMAGIVRALAIGRTDDVTGTAKLLLGGLLMLVIGAGLGGVRGGLRAQPMLLMMAGFIPTAALMLWVDSGVNGLLACMWYFIAWWGWSFGLDSLLRKAGELDTRAAEGQPVSRRQFLRQAGFWTVIGAGALGGLAYALDELLLRNPLAGIRLANPGEAPILRGNREDGFTPARGTRPEITPMPDFYKIDINILPPNVSADGWTLRVRGLVDNPLSLSYEEVLALEAVAQYATLACISNEVGGDLIGTTVFTGVRLATLLDMAGIRSGAGALRFESADGYEEYLPLEDAMRPESLLCYGMDGHSLTVEHGFPVRLYTPGRFGMKNPKWIETIEVVAATQEGYWTRRGWSREAFVKTTTVIDPRLSPPRDGRMPVGGIAFAGDKGISAVEVRLDDGDWVQAELRAPLSALTWVQWRVDLPFPNDGRSHLITARCVDGEGTPQDPVERGIRPDGATGYHQVRE